MLKELTIENIAIVKSESIKFNSPFSVITGETGAGKTIIIESIGLIMGDRASKELVRSGEKKAGVTAYFDNVPEYIQNVAKENGIECDGDIVISRELSLDSQGVTSTARINGRPVSANVLKEIAANLINLHTQHQSQTLMNDENHVIYLDSFADTEKEIADYAAIYEDACDKERKISKLKKSEQEKTRIIDMLKFQIEDIKQVSPKEGEEEALTELAVKIRNAEAISKNVRLITRALYSNDKGLSASDLMDKASDALTALGDIVGESEEYVQSLGEMRLKLEDIVETVQRKCSIDIDNPTAQLDKIETRLDAIEKLKRKYGQTVAEINKFREDAEKQLKDIETSDEQIEDIKNELRTVYANLKKAAEVLTKKRRDAADRLEKRIMSELSALEMEKVLFRIDIASLPSYSPNGIDGVTFLVSTNPGEPLLPLSKIASGGELSRMMLALKCALADKEKTPTLIFDEIDTGISGKTSHKIGLKLRSCGETCQVLCVTHSPQIACLAYEHMLVSKHVTGDGRTESGVTVLEKEQRIKEISRIIGGEKITEKTVIAATEMLEAAEKI